MYQATDRVGISAGLAYIQGGCNYKDIDINENVWHDHYLRADYVVVPILIHSYVAQGFSINAGLSPHSGFVANITLDFRVMTMMQMVIKLT